MKGTGCHCFSSPIHKKVCPAIRTALPEQNFESRQTPQQAKFLGQDTRTRRLEVIENMAELAGIEPTTSQLRTMSSPLCQLNVFNNLALD
jgi:hypothetical protein